MKIKEIFKKIWSYLKKDTWDSWLVSLIIVFLAVKFVFFPLLSIITGSPLPLVVVESCSMYHSSSNFDEWWFQNGAWYEENDISKEDFLEYPFKNGLNKGDIILTWGHSAYNKGDIIIFNAKTTYPLIHRIISDKDISTKGDHNLGQLSVEKYIEKEQLIGKASAKIPLLGWLKLIFFEPFKPENQRGLCK